MRLQPDLSIADQPASVSETIEHTTPLLDTSVVPPSAPPIAVRPSKALSATAIAAAAPRWLPGILGVLIASIALIFGGLLLRSWPSRATNTAPVTTTPAAATNSSGRAALSPRASRILRPTVAPQPTAQRGNLIESVIYADDFAGPWYSTMKTSTDNQTRYAFEDGAYQIEVKVPQMIAWSLAEGKYTDVAVQVDATLIRGPAATASGLVFRYQDGQNFYVFNVTNSGFYNLEVLKEGRWTTLIDWTPSIKIAGLGQRNTLRVEMAGERITLFVNDAMLEETLDRTFLSGQVALTVNTFERGAARVNFDNLQIFTMDRSDYAQ